MSHQPQNPRRFLATAAVAAGLVLGLQPGAASAAACKGLEQAACEANAECLWVDPYERKDGIKVKGYCRVKAPAKKPKADADKAGADKE